MDLSFNVADAASADTGAVITPALGLMAGTTVLTLGGVTPVEALKVGDRIVTRTGALVLRGIVVETLTVAPLVRISASALGIDQPEADLLVSPEQRILIRDWRAKALKGATQAVMTVAELCDGEYIRAETQAAVRRFTLRFDVPAVIYAGGVELVCGG